MRRPIATDLRDELAVVADDLKATVGEVTDRKLFARQHTQSEWKIELRRIAAFRANATNELAGAQLQHEDAVSLPVADKQQVLLHVHRQSVRIVDVLDCNRPAELARNGLILPSNR